MSGKYADIIVDISHERLDRTFQYRIPEKLEDRVSPGTRVKIPFGAGSRVIDGYVLDVTDQPAYDVSKIKDIRDISEGSVTVETKLIRLAAWMKNTYGSTMIRALRTILPVKEKERHRIREKIALSVPREKAEESLDIYEKKHYRAKARLMRRLLESPEIGRTEALRDLKVTGATLQSMEQEGVIRTSEYIDYRHPFELEARQQPETAVRMTDGQKRVYDGILREWSSENPRTCLIYGVTGSGKTLVYMELAQHVLEAGRQVIVLIPEIALSWQMVRRFIRRFGDKVAVIHSRLSRSERYEQFERVKKGEAQIMVGPRSALFTPFSDLGLIIIDEEQEGSYRSGETPRYDARETAIARGKLEDAHVVMGSATPSVDSFYRCGTGEFALFRLLERYGGAALPEVSVVDMREELRSGNRSALSGRLREEIRLRLERGEQSILFLNRRGYAGFVACRSCGYVVKCPHCDVSLTWHSDGRMICHYCGYETGTLTTCPSCGSGHISGFRAGTQKMEQMVQKAFPEARILRMDSDTTKGKKDYGRILQAFAEHQADILIGTQMVIKGHDFPDVTLAGVLSADLSLFASDYRAAEHTYQILVQAVGRAGRGRKKGAAVIQTYHPDHYSIQAAVGQDYDAFYEQEIRERRMMQYPPASNLLAVHGSCYSEEKLHTAMRYIRKFLIRVRRDPGAGLIGPAPEVVSRIQDYYREVLYLKIDDMRELQRMRSLLEQYIEINSGFQDVLIQFDVNI